MKPTESMGPQFIPTAFKYGFIALLVLTLVLTVCARTASQVGAPWSASTPNAGVQSVETPVVFAPGLGQATAITPIVSPTPDAPHKLPELRTDPEQYTVKAGDTLGKIAQSFNVSVEDIVNENDITNPDALEVGQSLTIPTHPPSATGPDFKIIPDSELVYGPGSVDFRITKFIKDQGGYLAHFEEQVDGETLSGAQIVQRVAGEFSVNPRLLLAVLEYQSGWVTKPDPKASTLEYPMGVKEAYRDGLYNQLSWAANNLNRGFYLWNFNLISAWKLADDSIIPAAPTINAGTAGVQQMFALLYGQDDWETAVSEQGVFATYNSLFGYPFARSIEPLVPDGLSQPKFQLPFEKGQVWNYTGGPHAAWADGSPWAALDFAPPGEALGCVESDAWVVAMADGPIIRAGWGEVIQDIDQPGAPADGQEQTGWVVLYMHIETRDRVQPGTYLRAGDRIGHPSCEGGVSTGTHTHIARRYNGEWISAGEKVPFVMDGWTAVGTNTEYDGYLKYGGQTVEAWEGRDEINQISR